MRLDPKKCPPGTLGYLPPAHVFEFNHAADFDWFKNPSVVLNERGEWEPLPRQAGEDRELWSSPSGVLIVYATWQSAVRYAIECDRIDAEAEIAEARKTIEQANAVEQWLSEAE